MKEIIITTIKLVGSIYNIIISIYLEFLLLNKYEMQKKDDFLFLSMLLISAIVLSIIEDKKQEKIFLTGNIILLSILVVTSIM